MDFNMLGRILKAMKTAYADVQPINQPALQRAIDETERLLKDRDVVIAEMQEIQKNHERWIFLNQQQGQWTCAGDADHLYFQYKGVGYLGLSFEEAVDRAIKELDFNV